MSEIVKLAKDDETADERGFTLAWRQAKALAMSDMVPDAHRGRTENCLLAMNMANRIGADPFAILSNMHVIHGKAGLSASFLIACFNATGDYGPIHYRWSGVEGDDSWTCTAWCRDRAFGDLVEGPPVSMRMAREEGWTTKKGSKWKTLPGLMMCYRAATFLIRTTAPEVSMGLHTAEELRDIHFGGSDGETAKAAQGALEAAVRDVTPVPEPEVEIDPDTGEVIPDDAGRQLEIDDEFVNGD